MAEFVFFDVGANSGSAFGLYGIKSPCRVVAFEPTPHLYRSLYQRCYGIVYPFAVSDFEGEADFHVAGHADWGCSSLLEFSEQSQTHWPGRDDLRVTETIKVPVVRLDRMLERMGLAHIDFLHVDAQGSDLKVLMGLGERIGDVEAGVVEAAAKRDILYKGQNTVEDTVGFLKAHGFDVPNINANDPAGNEVNIVFKRKVNG